MIWLYISSLFVFITFIIIMLIVFGKLPSISETYYRLEHWRKGSGWIFTVFIWVVAGSFVPFWLSYSKENVQFLAFFACWGLIFVGAAPQFKEGLSRKVHFVSALVSGIAASMWLIFSGMWLIFLIVAAIPLLLVYIRRDEWLFWVEFAGIMPTYVALIITYCNGNI